MADTYESTFDEARYFEECIATEMYCNWAPPMAAPGRRDPSRVLLAQRRAAQAQLSASATPTSPGDPWDRLWVADPTAPRAATSGPPAGRRRARAPGPAPLHQAGWRPHVEMLKERGAPYFWSASAPWHGTDPAADQLRAADLIDVHVGMASFRRWDQPAETPQQYWIELTDAGRRALAAST